MTSQEAKPRAGDAGLQDFAYFDDGKSLNLNRQDLQARIKLIPLDRINDGGAQMRVEMRAETVNEYAGDMLEGATFPAVVVFDDGTDLWLADGFHRVDAARKIGRETILAEVRPGTARDAILYAVGSNASHGLRRTQIDIRRALKILLTDPEWSRLSDRKLGEIAKVDHKTVGKYRRELAGERPHSTPKRDVVVTKPRADDGKPTAIRATLVDDVLRAIPDEALIAECRRRGLIGADDV